MRYCRFKMWQLLIWKRKTRHPWLRNVSIIRRSATPKGNSSRPSNSTHRQIRAIDGLGRPVHMAGVKGMQRDAKMGERMIDRRQEVAHFNVHGQLFVDLTAQTDTQIFVLCFELAARKFPHPAQHAVLANAGQSEAAIHTADPAR